MADECLWSFHCTVLTDYSSADELKPMNSVSKDSRRMRYSPADQHYLTCLIFWSVPATRQKDKSFIGRHNGVYFHSSAALCLRRIPIRRWPFNFVASWSRPFRPLPPTHPHQISPFSLNVCGQIPRNGLTLGSCPQQWGSHYYII